MLWLFVTLCCIVIFNGLAAGKNMREFSSKQFTWFLEDDRLLPILKDLTHPRGERRSYRVYESHGQKVFIKTFSEKGVAGRIRSLFAPRGKKEFIIAGRLASIGIPAPIPLGYGIGDRVSAIAEGFIEGTTLLMLMKEDPDREKLLNQLADFLLLLKENKVRHDDLHLDNILVSGMVFHLIDLHKVSIRRSFSDDDELANLTHALGTIYYDISPREKGIFFSRYAAGPEMRKKTTDAVEALRGRWVVNKMTRAFRDTSVVRRQGTDLFIRGREECAGCAYVATLKSDRKVKVERFADHVRKTYSGTKRLKTAWRNHVALEYMHKTVTPAAYCAVIPARGANGYIAMEDVTGRGEELDRYLDRNYDAMDVKRRKLFIDALAAFFQDAMRWNITHRDLKACNVFVLDSGGFLFLDVEDIRFTRVTAQVLKKAFCQLNNTIPKRISARDRIRFFLRLASLIDIDRKKLFREVSAGSLNKPIVYEGASGLVTDKW